jgi:hypothetical protein
MSYKQWHDWVSRVIDFIKVCPTSQLRRTDMVAAAWRSAPDCHRNSS